MTRGVSSNRFDRAVRRCLVSNVANDFTGLNAAITASMKNRERHASFDTPLGGLNLSYAKATRFGPSKVWVDLYYQRGRVTAPTQSSQTIASFRGTHEHTVVYRSSTDDQGTPLFMDGLPAGKVYFQENEKGEPEPVGRAYRRPVIKIYVSDIYLNTHPFGRVANALGKVNPTGPFMIGNYPFPIGAIRFDSVDVDWLEVFNQDGSTSTAFITDYVFSATTGGWFHHQIQKDPTGWTVTGDFARVRPNPPEFEKWDTSITFPWE